MSSSFGSLSTITMSDDEKDLFAEYLQISIGNPVLEFVRYLLGDDYLKFVDICSGTNFTIPSNRALERDINYIKIFLYVKKSNFTNGSIVDAGSVYKKTELAIKRIVLKVSKVLGTEDELSGVALENYIENIKSCENKSSVKEGCVEDT